VVVLKNTHEGVTGADAQDGDAAGLSVVYWQVGGALVPTEGVHSGFHTLCMMAADAQDGGDAGLSVHWQVAGALVPNKSIDSGFHTVGRVPT
jgi:hypothetical protein